MCPSSSQVFLFVFTSSILIYLLSPISLTLIKSSSAPAPAPFALNLTEILDKNRQYITFIRLLTESTRVANQITNRLDNSTEGFTVFTPTDEAFRHIKSGTLNSLTYEQLVQLILYHVVPRFYSFPSFWTVSNPVRTSANFGLYFTGHDSQVNVSSGMVETQIINDPLYSQFPLAIYQLDEVLLPPQLIEDSPLPWPCPAPTLEYSGGWNTIAPANSDALDLEER